MKDLYVKKQMEFEKVVENVSYMVLFHVHEQLDNFAMAMPDNPNSSNVQRSIEK